MRIRAKERNAASARRGAALIFATVIGVAIAGLALALLVMNLGTEKVRVSNKSIQRSFYAAEAGLGDAYMQLSEGVLAPPKEGEPAVQLGNAQAPLTLGPMSYWVEINALPGGRTYSVASTGVKDGVQERLEIVLAAKTTGFFQYAAFGADGVNLDSNALVDSYDSSLGTYASQVQAGNSYARENGNVGSNGDIVMRSNTEIHGDATPGPSGILDDSAPRTYVSGSTENAEELVILPPIEVPAIPSSGNLVSNGDLVLGPGLIHYDMLRMQGGTTLTILGPATVVLDDYSMKSGASMILDASAGEIDIYGTGNFVLESNTTMTTLAQSAVDLTIYLSGDNMSRGANDNIQLSSNAEFIGAIYAPNIDYSLQSNFTVYGSIMCGRLDLSSNGEIHFDEALLWDGEGEPTDFDVALWRELPHQ